MIRVDPSANCALGHCDNAEVIDLSFAGHVDNIEGHGVNTRTLPVIAKLKLGLISACNIDIGADGDSFPCVNKTCALDTRREGKVAVGIDDRLCTAHEEFIDGYGKLFAAEVGGLLQILANQNADTRNSRGCHARTAGNSNRTVLVCGNHAAADCGDVGLEGKLIGCAPAGESGYLIAIGTSHPISLHMKSIGNNVVREVISIEICHTYGGNGVLVMCGIGNGEIAGRIGRRIEDKSDCAVGLSNPALLVNGKLRAELCENKLAGYVNAFVIRIRTRFQAYIFPVTTELRTKPVGIGGFIGELILIIVCTDMESEVIKAACKAGQIGAVIGACNAHGSIEGSRHTKNSDIGIACKSKIVIPKACIGAVSVIACSNSHVDTCFKSCVEYSGYFRIARNRTTARAETQVCGINAQKDSILKSCGDIDHACSTVGIENLHDDELCIGSDADILDVIGIYQVGGRCTGDDACYMRTVASCVGSIRIAVGIVEFKGDLGA